jgi:tetratricopeptide (TPR) repeat protein
MSGQTDVSVYASMYPLYLGCLSLAEGEWDEAGRYLENAAAMAEDARWEQSLLAERDLLLGCPDAARVRLVPLLDRPGLEEFFVTRFLPTLAWAHLELGEIGEAEHVVAQALRRMRADNLRLDLPDALRVQAMVLIRQGRWAEAVQALEEGLALARSMPYPYAEARLLHVYGLVHVEQGEPEAARERLEAALAIFRRLGARKDMERTEQMLTSLG